MDKTNGMTTYDIIYDTILLESELYNYRNKYDFRELVDGDDGYVKFIKEKIEEFEKQATEYYLANGNHNNWSIEDAMSDFVGKNIDKWIRQLKGVKHCKVKVVLEVELDVSTGCNMPMVEELIKSNLIYDIDPALEYENASVKILNAVGKEVGE